MRRTKGRVRCVHAASVIEAGVIGVVVPARADEHLLVSALKRSGIGYVVKVFGLQINEVISGKIQPGSGRRMDRAD